MKNSEIIEELDVNKIANDIIDTIHSHYEKEIKVLNKALELACEWMSRYCIPCPPLKDCPSVECSQSKSDCYYRYFIQQAKESLKW